MVDQAKMTPKALFVSKWTSYLRLKTRKLVDKQRNGSAEVFLPREMAKLPFGRQGCVQRAWSACTDPLKFISTYNQRILWNLMEITHLHRYHTWGLTLMSSFTTSRRSKFWCHPTPVVSISKELEQSYSRSLDSLEHHRPSRQPFIEDAAKSGESSPLNRTVTQILHVPTRQRRFTSQIIVRPPRKPCRTDRLIRIIRSSPSTFPTPPLGSRIPAFLITFFTPYPNPR